MNAMFNSTLANEMTMYIDLRIATFSEPTVNNDKRTLRQLDQYLVQIEFQGKSLTEDVLSAWVKNLCGKSKTINEKLGVVRNFGKYLNTLGYFSFLPAPLNIKSNYIPYIFSDEEIAIIFYYADNMIPISPKSCSPYFQLKIPMALRIFYSCGTRLQETIELRRKDIDFKNRTIFLKKTKFSKQRIIPIHNTLAIILEHYCLALGIMNQPDAFLFPGKKVGTHYTSRQLAHWFAEILKSAGIDQHEKNPHERGACLHCFRHLFVLKSLQQLEAAGHSVDINDLLLPTYLGHKCLLDTDKYMRFSGVQVPESLDVFESFTNGLIPNVEVTYEEN